MNATADYTQNRTDPGADPAGRSDSSGLPFGIDCPFGAYDGGGCVGGSLNEPRTYAAQLGGSIVGGTVGGTCAAAVIGFTGGS